MNNKKLSISLFLALILLVVGFFIYYLSQNVNNSQNLDQSQNLDKVKVSLRGYLGYHFWIAEEKGFFKDENIEVVLTGSENLSSSEESEENRKEFRNWLSEGGADVAILTTDELFKMEIEHPGDTKAFIFFSDSKDQYSTNFLVNKNSNINSIKSLEGKKIAVESSDTDKLLLSHYMKSMGIDNFNLVEVTRESWGESLQDNIVDAIWASEPQVSQIVNKGIGKKLVINPNNNPQSDVSGSVTDVIVFRSDFIDKNPKIVDKFEKAFEKSIEVDENELKKIVINRLGSDWKTTVEARTFAKTQNSSQVDKALLQKLADLLFEEKYLSKKIDVSRLIYGQKY